MEPSTLERRRRMVVGGLMLATLAFALIFLQQQFDQGDYRKALELLASKPPGARWSVGQELLERAGATSPDCHAKLISSFAGTLEVTCVAGDPAPYRFGVDLVRKQVSPADDRTRDLMQSVERKKIGAEDGGVPPTPHD